MVRIQAIVNREIKVSFYLKKNPKNGNKSKPNKIKMN